jgi:hypothetical protein
MSKVKIGHVDVFIIQVTNVDNIPEKYHFDVNHKWVANNSDTKTTAIRKIKANPMNLTVEIEFAIDVTNNNQQHMEIHYALIGNQPITDL